ncbi:MAG: hypothetical protein ACREBR_02490, partial [bacterium]
KSENEDYDEDETANTGNEDDSSEDGPSLAQLESVILNPKSQINENSTSSRVNLNPRSILQKRPTSARTSPPSPSGKGVRKASRS